MAVLVLWVLLAASIGGSDATWCVCRGEMGQAALQKTLDYACGAGADCGPILQSGPCYQPNTVLAHCSYAANSYFQRRGQVAGTCDFSGTAMIATTDPSSAGCSYPSTTSAAGTGTTTTPTTTTPGSTIPTPGMPAFGTTPTTFAPPGSSGGNSGVLGGLGPSGPGNTMSTDGSGAGLRLNAGANWVAIAAVLPGLVWLRGWQ